MLIARNVYLAQYRRGVVMFDFLGIDTIAADKQRRIDTTAIVSILIGKGIITKEEWDEMRVKATKAIEESDEESTAKARKGWETKLGKK
jgi:hypothetical protein